MTCPKDQDDRADAFLWGGDFDDLQDRELNRKHAMDFPLNGFRIHYGEHTGVWWVESLHGSLNGLQFRTREAATAWVRANS